DVEDIHERGSERLAHRDERGHASIRALERAHPHRRPELRRHRGDPAHDDGCPAVRAAGDRGPERITTVREHEIRAGLPEAFPEAPSRGDETPPSNPRARWDDRNAVRSRAVAPVQEVETRL